VTTVPLRNVGILLVGGYPTVLDSHEFCFVPLVETSGGVRGVCEMYTK